MGWPIWLEAQLAYTGWAQAHPNLILGPTCSFFFFCWTKSKHAGWAKLFLHIIGML